MRPLRGQPRSLFWQALTAATILLSAGSAWSASISGPSTSTTGSFQLTWPTGYELWLHNAAWKFAGPATTTHQFTGLPSGTYRFGLRNCVVQYIDYVGDTLVCYQVAGSEKVVTVTRDAPASIDTGTQAAGTTPYQATVSLRGASGVSVPLALPPGVNRVAPDRRWSTTVRAAATNPCTSSTICSATAGRCKESRPFIAVAVDSAAVPASSSWIPAIACASTACPC